MLLAYKNRWIIHFKEVWIFLERINSRRNFKANYVVRKCSRQQASTELLLQKLDSVKHNARSKEIVHLRCGKPHHASNQCPRKSNLLWIGSLDGLLKKKKRFLQWWWLSCEHVLLSTIMHIFETPKVEKDD